MLVELFLALQLVHSLCLLLLKLLFQRNLVLLNKLSRVLLFLLDQFFHHGLHGFNRKALLVQLLLQLLAIGVDGNIPFNVAPYLNDFAVVIGD